MNAPKFNTVIGQKRYNTEKAELIADNVYWDGHNMERGGRNQWLYKTKNGNYFTTHGTFWQGERDTLTPLSLSDALEVWEYLPEKHIDFEYAFPTVQVEDA